MMNEDFRCYAAVHDSDFSILNWRTVEAVNLFVFMNRSTIVLGVY